ncbi:MAG: hypothetical protein HUK25_02805 [Treponema sp.]|nr:hypothetical protein [Treponema sp.]
MSVLKKRLMVLAGILTILSCFVFSGCQVPESPYVDVDCGEISYTTYYNIVSGVAKDLSYEEYLVLIAKIKAASNSTNAKTGLTKSDTKKFIANSLNIESDSTLIDSMISSVEKLDTGNSTLLSCNNTAKTVVYWFSFKKL